MNCRRLFPLIVVLAAADVIYAFLATQNAPFPSRVPLGAPSAYRNLYVHVPLAWGSYLMFFIAMVTGLLYLTRRREKYDRLTLGFVTVGEVFGVGTIVTGMAWAKESWGAAWSWDPRQTGVLLLLLAYLGYFAIRSSIPDPERRRIVSSAYAVAAFSMVPLSFLAAYLFESLHPSFQQARSFMWLGNVAVYFVPRILSVAVIGGLLALLLSKALSGEADCPRKQMILAGAAIAVVGTILAAYTLVPYLAGDPVRVINASLTDDGRIVYIETTSGTITFPSPIESPVKPPEVNGTPTIIGHLVVASQEGIEVVVHWSVAWNLLVYTISVGGLLAVAGIISRGAGR